MPKRTPPSAGSSYHGSRRSSCWMWCPPVRRRLIETETIKLPKLDRVIQSAFDCRSTSHLHEFIIGGVGYAYPDPDGAERAWARRARTSDMVLLDGSGTRGALLRLHLRLWRSLAPAVAIVEDRHIQISPTSQIYCSAGENAAKARRRMSAVRTDMRSSSKSSPTQTTRSTNTLSAGPAATSIPSALILDPVNRAIAKLKNSNRQYGPHRIRLRMAQSICSGREQSSVPIIFRVG